MAEHFSTGDVNISANALKTAYANGVIAIFGGTIGFFMACEACAMLAKRNGFKPREVFFYNHKPF